MIEDQDEDEGVTESLDDIYLPEPEHVLAPAKAFAAWHHPRKHHVRLKQWCAEVRKLIPQLKLGEGDPFRYLTLPGNELLDVRTLHGVCDPLQIKLRYLGFNSVGPNTPDQVELALSQSEVRGLSSIDEFSMVIEDRLEAVANDRSPASLRTRQAGPFHAINLDLCDSIAFREIGHAKGSPLKALGHLLSMQLQASTPWLLFITTKARPELTGDFAREGFTRAISANAEISADFRVRLAELISADLETLESELAAAWLGQNTKFLRLFSMGLGKWLLSILASAAPPREFKLLSSCYYQDGPGGPDMLSLAFRCEAPLQTLQDAFAILPAAQPLAPVSELGCAILMAQSVGQMLDLDGHLAADQALCNKLIEQTGRLLGRARYSEEGYASWAKARLG